MRSFPKMAPTNDTNKIHKRKQSCILFSLQTKAHPPSPFLSFPLPWRLFLGRFFFDSFFSAPRRFRVLLFDGVRVLWSILEERTPLSSPLRISSFFSFFFSFFFRFFFHRQKKKKKKEKRKKRNKVYVLIWRNKKSPFFFFFFLFSFIFFFFFLFASRVSKLGQCCQHVATCTIPALPPCIFFTNSKNQYERNFECSSRPGGWVGWVGWVGGWVGKKILFQLIFS